MPLDRHLCREGLAQPILRDLRPKQAGTAKTCNAPWALHSMPRQSRLRGSGGTCLDRRPELHHLLVVEPQPQGRVHGRPVLAGISSAHLYTGTQNTPEHPSSCGVRRPRDRTHWPNEVCGPGTSQRGTLRTPPPAARPSRDRSQGGVGVRAEHKLHKPSRHTGNKSPAAASLSPHPARRAGRAEACNVDSRQTMHRRMCQGAPRSGCRDVLRGSPSSADGQCLLRSLAHLHVSVRQVLNSWPATPGMRYCICSRSPSLPAACRTNLGSPS